VKYCLVAQEELAKHLAGGNISELHVAFSREGPQKDYVQVYIATTNLCVLCARKLGASAMGPQSTMAGAVVRALW